MRISDWSSDVCSSDLLEGFLGDGAHRLHVAVELQVQHRANVERANRSVGVPGAVGAVLAEDLGEAAGVLGEVRKLHRAVLDEGHRFALRLHRHRSEEHTSELQSLMRISYAVFCLKKKKKILDHEDITQ